MEESLPPLCPKGVPTCPSLSCFRAALREPLLLDRELLAGGLGCGHSLLSLQLFLFLLFCLSHAHAPCGHQESPRPCNYSPQTDLFSWRAGACYTSAGSSTSGSRASLWGSGRDTVPSSACQSLWVNAAEGISWARATALSRSPHFIHITLL